MPPRPSMATMRYRPAKTSPGENRPSREVRGVDDRMAELEAVGRREGGSVDATVRVAIGSASTAIPQAGQKRAPSATSLLQALHSGIATHHPTADIIVFCKR